MSILDADPEVGQMDQAIYICSADGFVQYFNQQFLNFTELPEDVAYVAYVAYVGARQADVFELMPNRAL